MIFINPADNTDHLIPNRSHMFLATTIMHKKRSKVIMLKIWHINIGIKDKLS